MQLMSAQEFREKLPDEGRLLAIDHGRKRIGLAMSDLSQRFANPLETLTHTKFKVNAERIRAIVNEHDVAGVIIGYPLNMDGTAGPRCQSVRGFLRNLEAYVEVPMLLWDERLSSDRAHMQMIEGGLRAAQRGERVDKLAAAAILESYMEANSAEPF